MSDAVSMVPRGWDIGLTIPMGPSPWPSWYARSHGHYHEGRPLYIHTVPERVWPHDPDNAMPAISSSLASQCFLTRNTVVDVSNDLKPFLSLKYVLSFIHTSQFFLGKFIPAIFFVKSKLPMSIWRQIFQMFLLKMEENRDFCLL